MAIQTLNTIKQWFRTSLKPTQAQFWDTWDSFRHKYEKVPVKDVEGIEELLQSKTENEVFENHLNDPNAHAELIKVKLDKGGYNGTAKDLNDRIAAIDNPDALLEFVRPTRTGAVVTFPAMKYIARINQMIVTNTLEYSNIIEVATTNYHRTDLIELLADGTFNKVVGEESLTDAIKPSRSNNAVEVSTINVFGNIIYDPSNPFDPTDFLPRGAYNGTAYDLANAIPNLNATNLKLAGYSNARNDGQIPTNKVLSTDAEGNLRLYTIAITPAPYLEELIPDSYLPSTTGNFVLKGSFFTPTMTIAIEGQTINSKSFISDNEFLVNVTTGNAEGTFDIILNNGITATFPGVFLVVLGTVIKPTESDWVYKNDIDISLGDTAKVILPDVMGTAKWIPPIDYTGNFRISFKFISTPLSPNAGGNSYFSIYDILENHIVSFRQIGNLYIYYGNDNTLATFINYDNTKKLELRKVGSLITLHKDDGTLIFTLSNYVTINSNCFINLSLSNFDVSEIKYIQTA